METALGECPVLVAGGGGLFCDWSASWMHLVSDGDMIPWHPTIVFVTCRLDRGAEVMLEKGLQAISSPQFSQNSNTQRVIQALLLPGLTSGIDRHSSVIHVNKVSL